VSKTKKEAPLLERLDNYIEYATARTAFSDVNFYQELKHHIEELEETIDHLNSELVSWESS